MYCSVRQKEINGLLVELRVGLEEVDAANTSQSDKRLVNSPRARPVAFTPRYQQKRERKVDTYPANPDAYGYNHSQGKRAAQEKNYITDNCSYTDSMCDFGRKRTFIRGDAAYFFIHRRSRPPNEHGEKGDADKGKQY